MNTVTIELDELELKELHDFWIERLTSSSPLEPKMLAVSRRIRQIVFDKYREQGASGTNSEALRIAVEIERQKDI